jgi:hypothetical protein
VSRGDTPAVFAERLLSLRRIPRAEVDLLRRSVEHEQYADRRGAPIGGEERAAITSALISIEKAIHDEADQTVRRRARLLPASLFVRSDRVS